MRIIGLDIHRAFAEAVAWKNGKLSRLGRVIMRREQLQDFAKQLSNSDVVVIEATGNAASVAAVIGPHVSRVVIANPKQVRLIAHAKIKTDKISSRRWPRSARAPWQAWRRARSAGWQSAPLPGATASIAADASPI